MTTLRCFTAYDIRGRVPETLNEEIARRIGLAFVEVAALKRVVIGRDMRLSSPALAEALSEILTAAGIEVLDIGLCGTEEVYHAVFSGEAEGVDGGIMVTASHNPADYNGMKLVGRGARPVSSVSGLGRIAELAGDDVWYQQACARRPAAPGRRLSRPDKSAYIEHLLGYVHIPALRPLTIVANPGNGCAGPVLDLLAPRLPCTIIPMYDEPDGSFPHGVPNPLLPENRAPTAEAVRRHGADLGLAWDGDFDRCFFYDEGGRFIEGYYMVGLLAQSILRHHPGATILHDPRLTWNTEELVRQAGGVPRMTRTGHAFIKEAMRESGAVYGGEMSAHHYFRDFGCCDSGMVPWLLVCQLMSETGQPLSRLVDERMRAYPVSGEINSRVADVPAAIARVRRAFPGGVEDATDGLSLSFAELRFNLRASNTEPVLRLNVETRGDETLLRETTARLLTLINSEA
ncbi:MAG: phosphomannomutase [Desulfobulbaceae bacterium A2]|nr:MAG: phosphomannomutase [Desulfobulbaceae bacterium A2]